LRVSEEGGHFVEISLGPLVEGMVMALGAGDVDADHDLSEVGERVELHPRVAKKEAGSRILAHVPFRGEQFGHNLVIGLVGLDLITPPLDVGIHPHAVLEIAPVEAIHIGEVIEKMGSVTR
jgi:hypothetical protein